MSHFQQGDVVAWELPTIGGMQFPSKYGDVVAVHDDWIVIATHNVPKHQNPLHVMHRNDIRIARERLRLAA